MFLVIGGTAPGGAVATVGGVRSGPGGRRDGDVDPWRICRVQPPAGAGGRRSVHCLLYTSDIRARKIDVDYASHSPQVDAIRVPLAEALAGIEPRSSSVAFFSTVTGALADTAGLDAEYWYRSIRQTVEFERAIRSARDAGYRMFVESSPHPVLIAGIEQTLADHPNLAPNLLEDAVVIPSLGRNDGGLDRFLLSVGQAHVAGARVDWRAVLAGTGGRRVELPTYAFVRRRFWLAPESTLSLIHI